MSRAIQDEEIVVRSIKRDWLKNGRLQYSAFRPSTGKTLVSLISAIEGADYCKDKSVQIHLDKYSGLAVLQAGEIRALGALVVDAPEDFQGHIHLDHIDPPVPSTQNPLEPGANKVLNDRCRALAKLARYHQDAEPAGAGWIGPDLA